jgi:alanine-alpha-ketoisovalerate/valine-pyruvate aminotransferase
VAWINGAESSDCVVHLIVHVLKRGGLVEAGCHLVVVCHIEDGVLYLWLAFQSMPIMVEHLQYFASG